MLQKIMLLRAVWTLQAKKDLSVGQKSQNHWGRKIFQDPLRSLTPSCKPTTAKPTTEPFIRVPHLHMTTWINPLDHLSTWWFSHTSSPRVRAGIATSTTHPASCKDSPLRCKGYWDVFTSKAEGLPCPWASSLARCPSERGGIYFN